MASHLLRSLYLGATVFASLSMRSSETPSGQRLDPSGGPRCFRLAYVHGTQTDTLPFEYHRLVLDTTASAPGSWFQDAGPLRISKLSGETGVRTEELGMWTQHHDTFVVQDSNGAGPLILRIAPNGARYLGMGAQSFWYMDGTLVWAVIGDSVACDATGTGA